MLSPAKHTPTPPEILLDRAPFWSIPCLLFLTAIVVYANSFPGAYIQDDLHIVLKNPLVVDFDLGRIFRSEYWQGLESNGLYRPLTIFSFALNRLLGGSETWTYHLVNVLLHAGVTVAFWRLLRSWDFSPLPALLAGLLFALHPLHTEVINQMVGRSELLAALFLLLALTSARYDQPQSSLLVCGFYLAALLSKEHAITLLGLLPLLDIFTHGFTKLWQRRAHLYSALLGITALWLLWRKLGVNHEFPATVLPPEVVPLVSLPWINRLLSAILLQGFYLFKLLFPLDLQSSYVPSELPGLATSIFSGNALLALLGMALLVTFLYYGARRRHSFALLTLLYLISFALTANLFFPIGVTFAERLAYFPSLWFCAGLSLLLCQIVTSRRLQAFGWSIALCYLLLLAVLTLARNPDFSSPERYWAADLRKNPGDYLALVNYTELLAAAGRYPEADEGYRQLFELAPTFAYAYRSYTNYLIILRRFDQAQDSAQHALSLARERGDKTGIGYDLGDLARIHLERKEYAQALARLDEGAAILGRKDFDLDLRQAALAGLRGAEGGQQPLNKGGTGEASLPMAQDLLKSGRLDEARTLLEGRTRQGGADAEGWNLLGVVCAQLADWPAAVAAFTEATRLAPENSYYRDNLHRAQQSRDEDAAHAR